MKRQAQKEGAKESSKTASRPAAAGPSLSAVPPAYGIDFVDEMLMDGRNASAQPSLLLQRKTVAAPPPSRDSGALPIDPSGGPLEKEADRVADHIIAATSGSFLSSSHISLGSSTSCNCSHCARKEKPQSGGSPAQIAAISLGVAQRPSESSNPLLSAQKEHKGGLHRTPEGSGATPQTAPPIVHDTLRSPGAMLDPATRAFFEARFHEDFSGVRMHTDSRAAESARAVNALAYTVGRDIAFAPGRFAPATTEGRRLLAHELTHTLQQPHSAEPTFPVQAKLSVGAPDDQYEREADQVADRVVRIAGQAAPSPLHQYVVGMPGRAVRHQILRLVQREPEVGQAAGGTEASLDQQYVGALQSARATGDWQDAAEKLHGFNREEIQSRLAQLSDAEVGYMHQGALDNPRLGPDWQVAQLTTPGTPRASTPPPASSPAGAPAPTAPAAPVPDTTSQLSVPAKLVEAIRRGMQSKQLGKAVTEQLNALLDPQSVSIGILFWMASHYDGLGELLDAAALIFEGLQFKAILEDLWDYATIAIAAQSNEDLDKAGEEFATAVVAAGVLKLLSMIEKLGSERKGTAEAEKPPEGQKGAPHDEEGAGPKDQEGAADASKTSELADAAKTATEKPVIPRPPEVGAPPPNLADAKPVAPLEPTKLPEQPPPLPEPKLEVPEPKTKLEVPEPKAPPEPVAFEEPNTKLPEPEPKAPEPKPKAPESEPKAPEPESKPAEPESEPKAPESDPNEQIQRLEDENQRLSDEAKAGEPKIQEAWRRFEKARREASDLSTDVAGKKAYTREAVKKNPNLEGEYSRAEKLRKRFRAAERERAQADVEHAKLKSHQDTRYGQIRKNRSEIERLSRPEVDLEPTLRGRANEERVLKEEGLLGVKRPFTVRDPKTREFATTIPDGIRPNGRTVDVKDVAELSETQQLRLQREVSRLRGLKAEIITGNKTKVSFYVGEHYLIVRRSDLGPR